jgi:hypothetical protein
MIHPHTELRYINDEIGYGVFATKFIPQGTITWVLDDLDQILEPSWVEALDPLRKQDVLKYSFRNQYGQYVLCWDKARFVNHSFHANCVETAYDLELAARDIYPGEQLTDDYGTLNLDEPFDCLPEPGTERVRAMPDDLFRYHPYWDHLAREAFRHFNRAEQPLKDLIKPQWVEKVQAVADQKEPLDSIVNIYYDRNR